MGKQVDIATDDIATEEYRGPGKAVTSAGYAYLSHAVSMVTGVAVAATAAYFAHRPIHKAIVQAREFGAQTGGWRGKAIGYLFGAKPGSHPLSSKLEAQRRNHPESAAFIETLQELVKKEEMGLFESIAYKLTKHASRNGAAARAMENQSEEKLSSMLIGGGIGGVLGYIASSVWAVVKGTHDGHKGKRQFERAQAEIKHLRETNGDLEKINDELHAKYVQAETRFKDSASLADGRADAAAPDGNKDEAVSAPAGDNKPATADPVAPGVTLSDKPKYEGTLTAAPEIAVA